MSFSMVNPWFSRRDIDWYDPVGASSIPMVIFPLTLTSSGLYSMVSTLMVAMNVFLIDLAFSPSPIFIFRDVSEVRKSPGSMSSLAYHRSSTCSVRSFTVPFLKSLEIMRIFGLVVVVFIIVVIVFWGFECWLLMSYCYDSAFYYILGYLGVLRLWCVLRCDIFSL